MNESEAQELAAMLFAAFPRDWQYVDNKGATNAVYVQQFQQLRNPDALSAAISSLAATETRLPTIAAVRDEYRRLRDRYEPAALPEPELTEEQVRANLHRVKTLVALVEGDITLDEALKEVASEAVPVVRGTDRAEPQDVRKLQRPGEAAEE